MTAHYINEVIDDGAIISVLWFPIPNGSTGPTLRLLTYQYTLESLEDILMRMKLSDSIIELLNPVITCGWEKKSQGKW